MARITRKKLEKQTDEKTEAEKKYQVGIYARLSVKTDERKEESIDTQIAICKEYIEKNPDMVWVDSYIDLGKSGMNFERQGFEHMMKEAKEGKINCIIAKDLSRIGRNHLETGFYIEKYLPQQHIRLIAVNDCFDSLDEEENEEMVSLKNLVNEMYVRDISRKVSSIKRQKWENGEYMGGIPPYGYCIVKKGGKRELEVKEEQAEVVRKIYHWYLRGRTIEEIIENLYQEGINPPRELQRTGNIQERKRSLIKRWSVAGIKNILTNPVYLGCMVKKKKKGEKYKICSEKDLEFLRDLMQENTHSMIVSRKIFFETAKKIRRVNTTE